MSEVYIVLEQEFDKSGTYYSVDSVWSDDIKASLWRDRRNALSPAHVQYQVSGPHALDDRVTELVAQG